MLAWKSLILVVLLALTQHCAPLPLVDSGKTFRNIALYMERKEEKIIVI
jgi:hypothetical protein